MNSKGIHGGLYLVIDPAPGVDLVLPKIRAALKGGVDVIQLWNHWHSRQDQHGFIEAVIAAAQPLGVPVLIHEAWQWLKTLPLDGIHFDAIPGNWSEIGKTIGRPFITGLTCSNDPERIDWALKHANYISFCSMFPSSSTDTCEIVHPQIIERTRSRTNIPIFAAGGITTENLSGLLSLGIDGIAVISAVMKAPDPQQAAARFKHQLTKNIHPS
ncbi:MAG TPA: thiamine phosphate synthase [Ohtaekwangia sp.]|uniref:thiamine phosphate synthase n=1 Tax=Ohtaekwangia sp. TaxID=2066019 RepID=UPI002F92CEF1